MEYVLRLSLSKVVLSALSVSKAQRAAISGVGCMFALLRFGLRNAEDRAPVGRRSKSTFFSVSVSLVLIPATIWLG